jgi:hypothetical protein
MRLAMSATTFAATWVSGHHLIRMIRALNEKGDPGASECKLVNDFGEPCAGEAHPRVGTAAAGVTEHQSAARCGS